MHQLLHLQVLLLLWTRVLLCLASSPSSPATIVGAGTPVPQQHQDPTFGRMSTTATTGEPDSAQHAPRPQLSRRITLHTEPAHIEAVLSRYAGMNPPPVNLAQGVCHWDPPPAALRQMESGLQEPTNHKYGPALGLPALREALVAKLKEENGLDMTGQEVMVTSGGNQAFAMVALALLDPGDRVLLARPFYCAHQCAVQLAGGTLVECDWDSSTLLPDMEQLRREVQRGVKMVVITTPGNPSGAVCPRETMEEIARLCGENNSWLVVDEAYEHFLYDGERHFSPCGNSLGSPDNVIHLFTMSKSFGLAGWRVGYAVYPSWASKEMVKVQDTLPTHACTGSQKIALAALEGGVDWVKSKVSSLSRCRSAMWAAVKDMGGVMGKGSFYFLVPVPVDEDRAVDVLARQWGVLTTPGRAFGAPGHIRVSYGSLPEEQCLPAIRNLAEGLRELSNEAAGTQAQRG
ncbi:unnamed protein product [Ectocarpus fasciculatus]